MHPSTHPPHPHDAGGPEPTLTPSDRSVAVVVVNGELDLSTLPEAEAQVAAAERAAPDVLVIDLSTLSFVDSSGVRLVLLAEERARAAGRRVAVKLGAGPALRVFRTLGLVSRLTIVDTVDTVDTVDDVS